MLSIRPDLVPPRVLFELQQLCDAVPPFASEDAVALIERELGLDSVAQAFTDLEPSTPPFAAASLGQVYKATLRSTGCTVAVKVQRPDMLAAVSLDLYILRQIAQCIE